MILCRSNEMISLCAVWCITKDSHAKLIGHKFFEHEGKPYCEGTRPDSPLTHVDYIESLYANLSL